VTSGGSKAHQFYLSNFFFHSRIVHLDIFKVFTPTDAQVFRKEY